MFNVGTLDRFARVIIGLALIAAAWFGSIGAWGWIGLLPLFTGLIGSCPAYLPFGFNTCSMKPRKGG
ncbi:hypothetical protein J2X20_002895 [Pelomonas saccharophila]|uniref:Inner membrane protein YgaP-like transmembrane domain-containing protein n=1 Tax=Roseateles saccharophilus TaxID=304 RepID=A0ABU1YN05_ROSSA|nr:DUF2892 domain-containing protein [Roseateles saccharophilus]MDR7270237.1 hypothetical protein [Roseateles saccharophilus]